MSNPDYATLLAQIAEEDDPVIKAQLIEQAYQFNEPLTPDEKSVFDYVKGDYIENNPGYDGPVFKAYVGVYYSDDGETT